MLQPLCCHSVDLERSLYEISVFETMTAIRDLFAMVKAPVIWLGVEENYNKKETYTFKVCEYLIPEETPYFYDSGNQLLIVDSFELGVESDHP